MTPTRNGMLGGNFRYVKDVNGSIRSSDETIKIAIGEEVFQFKDGNLKKARIGLPVKNEAGSVVIICSDAESGQIIVVIQDGDLEKRMMKLAVFEESEPSR